MRQTGHPHFTGDVRNIHDLQLTYGTYTSNSRRTERSHFMVDVQGMPALLTEFRQPLQVQSHLEMPRILVQLGHTQRT